MPSSPVAHPAAITPRQFDTAPPLHCREEALLDPQRLQPLSIEVPTIDSHTVQLLKFALLVFKCVGSAAAFVSRARKTDADRRLSLAGCSTASTRPARPSPTRASFG